MCFDGALDLKGEIEGLARLGGGDCGFCMGEDAGEEGFDFEAEGLAGGEGGLVEAEAGCWGGGRDGGLGGVRVDGDDEEVLTGVVDGDVLVGLEEAEFADAFGGDAAGGEVGDAA